MNYLSLHLYLHFIKSVKIYKDITRETMTLLIDYSRYSTYCSVRIPSSMVENEIK